MTSKDIKETEKIAQTFFLEVLNKNNASKNALVVALSGDLGAGKTTFTKMVAKLLGIKNKISSPTFVIMKKYILKAKKYKRFFHLDAYRLKNKEELFHLGWEEIVKDKENLVFIEWPEQVKGALPKNAHFVYISHTKNGGRNFKF